MNELIFTVGKKTFKGRIKKTQAHTLETKVFYKKILQQIDGWKKQRFIKMIDRLPALVKVRLIISLCDTHVKTLIENEAPSEVWFPVLDLKYWEGLKDLIEILYVADEEEKLEKTLLLLMEIIENNCFSQYRFEVSEWVHCYHPRFIDYKLELERVMKNV